MVTDREFDLVTECILEDENRIKCACGSRAISLNEMVKNGDNTFTCSIECWDCDREWEIKVTIHPLVEIVTADVFGGSVND